VREEAKKKEYQEEAKRSSPISISTHLGSAEEVEEESDDKNRRDKERVLKNKK
jgi:hypothetical protein